VAPERRLDRFVCAACYSKTDGVVLKLLQSRDIGRTPSWLTAICAA
jgi:hypothetical protein